MAADLFLIGDSHIIAIAEAAENRGLNWLGGPLSAGRMLERCFWEIDGKKFVYTMEGAGPIRDRFSDLLVFDGPILTTLGFNSHRFVADFAKYASDQNLRPSPDILSEAAFIDTVCDSRRVALDFYRLLADHGRDVYFTASPQRSNPPNHALLRAFEDVLIPKVEATGAKFIETRDVILDGPRLRPEYAKDNDTVHGNRALGALVLERLAAQIG